MKRLATAMAALAAAALLTAPTAAAQFGLTAFDVTYTDSVSSPATLAGSHPHEQTTSFTIATANHPQLGEIPVEPLQDLNVAQIPGLAGDPNAAPTCSTADFLVDLNTACANGSVVGKVENVLFSGDPPIVSSVYNLDPLPGQAARLGFWVATVPITVEIDVNSESPFNIVARLANTPQPVPLISSKFRVWGIPADPSHDVERGGPAGVPRKPFLTLPRACEGPLETRYEAISWLETSQSGFALTHDDELPPNPQGFEDCQALGFDPEVAAAPTTGAPASPSGFEFSIEIDDPGLADPDGRAESDLKQAVVTLPEGMTVNPAAAGGLAACTQAQLAGETFDSAPGDGCPQASKVASVKVTTPLLEEQLSGSIFLATPYENPLGTLLAGYLVIKQPERGIAIKLPGKIEADPQTGRLTASFDQNPQLPFSDLEVSFFAGPRAPLITPQTCGGYEVRTDLYPWADPDTPQTHTDPFTIAAPGGAPCASSQDQLPHSPSFDAGTVSPIAAAHSPFVVNLRREDGTQRFSAIGVTPPPGLLAKLAGTESCSDAALAAAAARPGVAEQASPSCPPSSEVGNVFAAAGAGPAPYWAPGKAYLAGPYKGAPLSLAVVTPAVAGPFDLGTVVVRTAFRVDPVTAQVSAISDPLPELLQGIPLDVRQISIRLDRPDFALNGTSCEPSAVSGLLTSTLGAQAALHSRFQLAECTRLGFRPRIELRLKGGTKRGDHPALITTLKPRPGNANISGLSLKLPRAAFLDQGNIGTVCTRVQWAADQCPAASVYGKVTARTPLLDYPLTGNVYLRSSDNLLPDLVPDLRGPAHQPIRVESAGRTDSVRGTLRNTFDYIPDAPVTSVTVRLFGGNRGLIVNSRDLCRSANRALVRFSAHNGQAFTMRAKLMAKCAKRSGKRKAKRGGS